MSSRCPERRAVRPVRAGLACGLRRLRPQAQANPRRCACAPIRTTCRTRSATAAASRTASRGCWRDDLGAAAVRLAAGPARLRAQDHGRGPVRPVVGVPVGFERVLQTRRPTTARPTSGAARGAAGPPAFDDPRLRARIGVQLIGNDLAASRPATRWRGRRRRQRGRLPGLSAREPAAQRMVQAVAARRARRRLVWGPQAGYFAAARRRAAARARRGAGRPGRPFEFAIAMGVRRGDIALRDARRGCSRAAGRHRCDPGRVRRAALTEVAP
jgi:hypothetical protein